MEFNQTLQTEIEQKSCLGHRLKKPCKKNSILPIAGTLIFTASFIGSLSYYEENKDEPSAKFSILLPIFSAFFLLSCLIVILDNNFDFNLNNRRFEKAPISQFSTKLQKIFRQICSAFTWSSSTIILDLDLSSSIETIQKQFKIQHNLITEQLTTLTSQKNIIEEPSIKKPDINIDIDIVIDHGDKHLTLDEEALETSEEKVPMLSFR